MQTISNHINICRTLIQNICTCQLAYWLSQWVYNGTVYSMQLNIPATIHIVGTVYPKKYAHGFCFAVLCCGYTLTDFPISIRLTSLALWQSNDCPSASKATLVNMDKYFMWIHYERLHNHNKAKHNKTVCIFLGIYCSASSLKWIDCPNLLVLTTNPTPTRLFVQKIVKAISKLNTICSNSSSESN